jgi:hypothetical protein
LRSHSVTIGGGVRKGGGEGGGGGLPGTGRGEAKVVQDLKIKDHYYLLGILRCVVNIFAKNNLVSKLKLKILYK